MTTSDLPSNAASAAHMTMRDAEAVVSQYFDMWNTGETTALADLIDPGWLDHTHPELHGPGDIAQQVERVRTARPDFRFHLEQILPGGDGYVLVVGRTTHSPTAATDPPTIWRIRMQDGRMVEMWTYRNQQH
jgi:ketosteroid isomerase-like protein